MGLPSSGLKINHLVQKDKTYVVQDFPQTSNRYAQKRQRCAKHRSKEAQNSWIKDLVGERQ